MENKENKENKRIHARITDNETGQVLFDSDGCFLLGAFCVDERQTIGILTGSSTPMQQLNALCTVDGVKERLFKDVPPLKRIFELYKALDLDKENIEKTEIDLTELLRNT